MLRSDTPRSTTPPPVRATALVSADGWMRLQRGIARGCVLECCTSASHLLQQVEAGACHAVVLDPTTVRPDTLTKIIDSIDRAGRGLVLYAPLTIEMARLAVEISARLPTELILRGVEDEGALLLEHLRRVASPSVPGLVMTHLTEPLRSLPPTLTTAVVGLFGWLPIPHRVSDLAEASAIERRSVERCLRRAGFCGAGPLLTGARLARTWSDLQDPHVHVASVAERNGFHSTRTLTDQCHRLLHLSPRAVRSQSPHTFARLIARTLLAS